MSARAARRLIETLVVALFPADCLLCGRPLPFRQRGSVCLDCWDRLPWSPGLRLGPGPLRAVTWAADYDGPVRRLIQALKFESVDYLGGLLGEEAAARLPSPLVSGPLRPDLVVPVPLHWWRASRRGYNQALLLARPLARRLRVPLAARLLVRHRAGRRQLGLGRGDRLRSLQGCYRMRRRGRDLGTVLLVDDVTTTGATLEACARALLRGGASAVVACVLARTPRLR
ncbi:MAG TPA: ComF family protein [Candidatus Polarisedimenticolia bacterium]|nr:ComF family protein [Candidatus Polarisedimenticolia bacterium]